MARVGRQAGALVVETGGALHAVGHFKEPCDGALRIDAPWLEIDLEGEPLLALLHARLVIERTGGVSERLWRLITHEQSEVAEERSESVGGEAPRGIDARWLAATPAHVWDVIKDAVLRCS
jgi:hypothetical protein